MGSSSASDPSPPNITVAEKAPVTAERELNLHLQEQLAKPYVARALVVMDPALPNGTEGHEHHNMSVLQQHAAFSDRNGLFFRGRLIRGFELWDSMLSRRSWGISQLILDSVIDHSRVGYLLLSSQFTSRTYIDASMEATPKATTRCKYGSDTESCDTEGRFEPSKFDAIFSKYA